MTKRSPVAVFVLSIVTLGIYALYWLVRTKTEMNSNGASIPTAWYLIIPLANIWWYWKFSQGVEKVTNKGMSAGVVFLMLWLLPIIGSVIIQSTLNEVAEKK